MPTRAVIVDATKHQYRFVANLAVAYSLSDGRTASQNRHGHRALRALQAPAICSRCRSCRDMRRLSSSRRQGARVALLLQLLQLLHHLSVAQKRNKQSRATIKQSGKQASNQAGKQSCNQAIRQSGTTTVCFRPLRMLRRARRSEDLESATASASIMCDQGSVERLNSRTPPPPNSCRRLRLAGPNPACSFSPGARDQCSGPAQNSLHEQKQARDPSSIALHAAHSATDLFGLAD